MVKNPVLWLQNETHSATEPWYLAESKFFLFIQTSLGCTCISDIHEWLLHKCVFYTPSGGGDKRYPTFDSTEYFIPRKSGRGDTQIEECSVMCFKGAKWFGKRLCNCKVSLGQACHRARMSPLKEVLNLETNIPHQINPVIYLEGERQIS